MLALEGAGHPVVRLEINDLYDLGAQFFYWELATVVAGYRLKINPFDQPNVEAAKVLARNMVATYQEQGRLPEPTPVLQETGVVVYSDLQADTLEGQFKDFLARAEPGDYIALQAYVQPTDGTDASLLDLRTRLRAATRLAVTSGYGPRYLHSTGQLHKGDGGNGLFVQLIAGAKIDADIPDQAGSTDSSISFGVLKLAQSLGDRQALLEVGRDVITFHLGEDVLTGLVRLSQALDISD